MPDAGRVIAGSARSIRLDAPGSGTRPLGDRVKQTLFAILEPDLAGDGAPAEGITLYSSSDLAWALRRIDSREVRRGTVPVELTPREFSMVQFLMRRCGEAVTKADILGLMPFEDKLFRIKLSGKQLIEYLTRKDQEPKCAAGIRHEDRIDRRAHARGRKVHNGHEREDRAPGDIKDRKSVV